MGLIKDQEMDSSIQLLPFLLILKIQIEIPKDFR